LVDADSPNDPKKVNIADGNVTQRKRRLIKLLLNQPLLRKLYAVLLGAICPLIVFFIVKNPVDILTVAGTIAAVHTPVVVYLTLRLNRTRLPERARPGRFFTIVMWLAGIAYGAFAVFLFISPGAQ
jgi:Mn2+/Fe2+ NRAMP family transporter